MAIQGAALAGRERGTHVITTSVEHPAVMEVCRHLDSRGFRTTFVPVDESGMADVGDVERAISEDTVLITVMHANNEVGTIQPVEAISALARERGIPFHTDAAQSVGKIATRADDLGVDFLSVAGHKLYAPKGVGALYARRGARLERLMFGAGHEQGRRPGTENVLEIVGLGAACEIAARDLEKNRAYMATMRDRLETGIVDALDEVRVNGHSDQRLPNTLSLSFRGVEANALLSEIPEIAASPGAACHSGEVQVSRVLEAMGVSPEYALGTVRFSTGRGTTVAEIDRAVELVIEAVKRLRP
jgi:cysteine desulfurase